LAVSASEQKNWEYRLVKSAGETELNALGRDGWELAGVAEGDEPELIFKRPLLSFREQVTLDQKRRYYALWGVTASEDDERVRP
jgi:hypothetical protein